MFVTVQAGQTADKKSPKLSHLSDLFDQYVSNELLGAGFSSKITNKKCTLEVSSFPRNSGYLCER